MGLTLKLVLPIIFTCSISYAGRPVFHELTTSDLSNRATWIVEVKKLQVKKIKLECGWDSEMYSVEVVRVLKPRGPTDIKAGHRIEFNPHPTRTLDCELRKDNSSGASFSAERYKSGLDSAQMNSSVNFVAFLIKNRGQLALVADHAIEKPEKFK